MHDKNNAVKRLDGWGPLEHLHSVKATKILRRTPRAILSDRGKMQSPRRRAVAQAEHNTGSTVYSFSMAMLLPVLMADDPCDPNCPDPFPPDYRDKGDCWWAIGSAASGAHMRFLATILEVPQKPNGVEGLRMINTAWDNSVSSSFLGLPHYRVLNEPESFWIVGFLSFVLIFI